MLYMHFRAHAILCAVLVRIHVRAQGARARADTFARFVSGYLVLQIRGTTVPRQPDREDVRGKRARGRGDGEKVKGLSRCHYIAGIRSAYRHYQPVNIDGDLPRRFFDVLLPCP